MKELTMDWGLIAIHRRPPCFFVKPGGGRYCGRADRWPGHDTPSQFHAFVSLDDLLVTPRNLLRAVIEDATGDVRDENKRVWPIRAALYREIRRYLAGLDTPR